MGESRYEEVLKVSGDKLLQTIREIVHQGNVRRIVVKNEEGHTFIEIPLAVGVVGALFLPVWAAVGAIAALASGFTLVVEKTEPPAAEPNDAGQPPPSSTPPSSSSAS